jgi:GNAT superfamily N-acetyltransferase
MVTPPFANYTYIIHHTPAFVKEGTMQVCAFCDDKPQYRDWQTGQYVCLAHARLEVTAPVRRPPVPPLTIRPAKPADDARLEELALYFWDEVEVDCFDRQYDVRACPAFLACNGDKVVGLASYTVEKEWGAMVLVMLNVLPDYQGRGAGRALLDAVRDEATRHGRPSSNRGCIGGPRPPASKPCSTASTASACSSSTPSTSWPAATTW